MVNVKSAPLTFIKSDELGEGEFLAYAATFTAKDSYGDVMHKNSFDEDIAAWEKRDDVMPVLWNHDTRDPKNNIGEVKARRADDHGYLVHAKFDLDTHTGAHVHRLVKGKRVTQLSFAYDELDAHPVKGDPQFGNYNSVDRVAVHEVSITPYGANRTTEVLAVKAALDTMGIEDPAVRQQVGAQLLKMANELLGVKTAEGTTDEDATRKAAPPEGHADSQAVDELVRKFDLAGLPREFVS
jgi:HK97 family phage prohead protease